MSDTSTLAAFERVFDTGGMSVVPTPATTAADAVADARALTQKLSRSLGIPTATTLIDRARPRPVGSALQGLFARGGLPPGEVVSIDGRAVLSLALACCAETTRDGGWCAGIGLGAPAAAAMQDMGVDLSRFVRLDTPAQDWMRVTSILLESFDVLVVAPGFSASAGDRARIAAKLRDSRATLILLNGAGAVKDRGSAFPGSSERLTVLEESWEGTDSGTGRLRSRTLRLRSAHTGEHTLVLPDPRGTTTSTTTAPQPRPSPAFAVPPASDVPAGTLRLVPDASTRSAGVS